jgi:hypothetical protein
VIQGSLQPLRAACLALLDKSGLGGR